MQKHLLSADPQEEGVGRAVWDVVNRCKDQLSPEVRAQLAARASAPQGVAVSGGCQRASEGVVPQLLPCRHAHGTAYRVVPQLLPIWYAH